MSDTFRCALLDCHQGDFMGPLSTGIFGDLDAAGQYEVTRNHDLDLDPSTSPLRCSLEINSGGSVGVEHTFLGYNFKVG